MICSPDMSVADPKFGPRAVRPQQDREPSRFAAARQPNTQGFFRSPRHSYALRTGTVRAPSDREPSRVAAAGQPNTPRFFMSPRHSYALRTGTVRAPSDREPSRFAAGRRAEHAWIFQTTSSEPSAATGDRSHMFSVRSAAVIGSSYVAAPNTPTKQMSSSALQFITSIPRLTPSHLPLVVLS